MVAIGSAGVLQPAVLLQMTMMKTAGSRNQGFTLIEMMIVVSIIGIILTMATPSYHRYIIRAKETSLRRTLFIFRDVIDQFFADQGKYPDSLEHLVENKYIRAVPIDPFTKSATTWIIIGPEGDVEGAVYDVHSGSYKVSLSGVPYNEW